MRFASALVLSSILVAGAHGGLLELLTQHGISVVAPNDPEYGNVTEAYNQRFTLKPLLVTFPANASQVADIVKIGSGYNHSIVARSGGHSYIANGVGGKDGSVVVDLRALKDIIVDQNTYVARVGTGNRLGDVALALAAYNRGIPHGTCPYVGIGGHAAHGGFGFPSRMWGLTLDNIKSVELVLPNGTPVNVSDSAHPNLFWAIRGAGSSFGIATAIEFNTHVVPPSGLGYTYMWQLNITEAVQASIRFQAFIQSDIPSELGLMLFFFPGMPSGIVSFGLTGGWYGDLQDFNATINPFLVQMSTPDKVIQQTGTFVESLQFAGAGSVLNLNTSLAPDANDTFYAKSIMTPDNQTMSPAAWEALMTYLANEGTETSLSWWIVEIEVWGGKNSAINAVPRDQTAFVHRGSMFTFQFYASSQNHKAPYPQEGFDFVDGLANSIIQNNPLDWNYGAYPNYVDDRLANWQTLYYGSHYSRLQAMKRVVDPGNLYSFPTSIQL